LSAVLVYDRGGDHYVVAPSCFIHCELVFAVVSGSASKPPVVIGFGGIGLADPGVFSEGVETGTGFVDVGEVAVTHDDGIGETAVEV
jgi:hypothetical protein